MTTFPFKKGDRVMSIHVNGGEGFIKVIEVGRNSFYGSPSWTDTDFSYSYDAFKPYTPPKKTVRMAPALVGIPIEKRVSVYWDHLFETEEEAKSFVGIWMQEGVKFIKFPASEALWFNVPVEDEK